LRRSIKAAVAGATAGAATTSMPNLGVDETPAIACRQSLAGLFERSNMRILHLVSGGAAAVGLALSLATPASAAPVRASASWLGSCYPQANATSAGGWCDGQGPNWRYQGYVGCTDGREYWGPARWAGDRRKSFGYCPTGAYRNYGGVQAFYVR
jgi:hypothetical protein